MFLKKTVLFELRFSFDIPEIQKEGSTKTKITHGGSSRMYSSLTVGRYKKRKTNYSKKRQLFSRHSEVTIAIICATENSVFRWTQCRVTQSCHSKATTISSVIARGRVRILINLFTGQCKLSVPCLCASVFTTTNNNYMTSL